MKRELKFKYYLKTKDKNGIVFNSVILTISQIENWKFSENIEDIVAIMQFTGLIDINGVEIYEGDIVKVNKDEVGSIDFNRGNFWVGFFQEPTQQNLSDFVNYNFKTDCYGKVEIEVVGKLAYLTR